MQRILIVDDDPLNRELLEQELSDAGYAVESVEDGPSAIRNAELKMTDLLLLDIMMPGMSGIEVLRRLRTNFSMTELPIMMVSAKDRSEDIVESLSLGANDYIRKPIDVPVLLARVRCQTALRGLSKLKDEFFGIASHDLKSPLMGITTHASLLLEMFRERTAMTNQGRRQLGRILSGARNMRRIIESFLDFHAMSDGRLVLERKVSDLNVLARKAIDYIADYAQCYGVELELRASASGAESSVDEQRILQVIHNLLDNAVKFSPRGTTVTVETVTVDGWVELRVLDGGPGIATADSEALFDRFTRHNRPSGREGSGLGLSISKKLIDCHQGEIGACNRDEGGASFWFRLPRN